MTQESNEHLSYEKFRSEFLIANRSYVQLGKLHKAFCEEVRARAKPILAESPHITTEDLYRRIGGPYCDVPHRWCTNDEAHRGELNLWRAVQHVRRSEAARARARVRREKEASEQLVMVTQGTVISPEEWLAYWHGRGQRNRERSEEMRNRYLAGERMDAIAQDYNVTGSRVHQLIRKYEKRVGAESSVDILRARQAIAKNERRAQVAAREKLLAERDAAILQLSHQGKTHAEIAQMLDINRGIVNRSLIKMRGRVKHKSKNVDEYTLNIWRGLAQAGVTQELIAKQTGYTQMAVSQALKREGYFGQGGKYA